MEKENKQETKTTQVSHKCNKPGCSNEGKLRCPNCKKLGIKEESYFCGKECFQSYWKEHRAIHEECI